MSSLKYKFFGWIIIAVSILFLNFFLKLSKDFVLYLVPDLTTIGMILLLTLPPDDNNTFLKKRNLIMP